MHDNELLSQITIPTPCPADWELMSGDERVRYCPTCEKHVHNFAAMTSGEAVALIRAQGGELCGQLSRHPGGKLVTSDSQPEPQSTRRLWQFNIRSLMALVAGLAATFGFARMMTRATGVTRGEVCIPPPAVQPITNPPKPISDPTDQAPTDSDPSDQECHETPDRNEE